MARAVERTIEGPLHAGRVLSGTGGVWQVRTGEGQIHEASLRGRLKLVSDSGIKLSVGDNVKLLEGERGTGWMITEIVPRSSQLARREPGGRAGERVVVANLDQVVVVFAAANPEPHPRMLDRFLVIAEANSLSSRIVINKSELVNDVAVHARFADYEAAGYPVHFTSVKRTIGLESLHAALDAKTSALSGPSGVGKSSLMNSLYPGLNLRVGEISESVNKGRHTTVGAVMHPLPGGGYVADTPGLREVGVWGLNPVDLPDCFPEFRPFVHECRFGNCSHISEPGCAVIAAVKCATVSAARHDSYSRLRLELEETEKRWSK
ncbi:MAG: ribosome small subunit-dependent GTPase A [Gemmatimonadota bacterium]|nr:ribosome small subunit-dependent GTPase A [Gemmatimonadota bacterium]